MNTAMAHLGAPAAAVAIAALVSSAAVLGALFGAPEGCTPVGVQQRSAPSARVTQRPAGPDGNDDPADRDAERRIAFARARLGITPEQSPQWDAFVAVLRERALLDDIMGQSTATVEPVSPHVHRRPFTVNGDKAEAAARAASEKQFAAARAALYDRLTAEQRDTAASLLVWHDGRRR